MYNYMYFNFLRHHNFHGSSGSLQRRKYKMDIEQATNLPHTTIFDTWLTFHNWILVLATMDSLHPRCSGYITVTIL